jgi:hypothetical protein
MAAYSLFVLLDALWTAIRRAIGWPRPEPVCAHRWAFLINSPVERCIDCGEERLT